MSKLLDEVRNTLRVYHYAMKAEYLPCYGLGAWFFEGLLLAYSVEKLTSDGNTINSDWIELSNILFLLNHVPAGTPDI